MLSVLFPWKTSSRISLVKYSGFAFTPAAASVAMVFVTISGVIQNQPCLSVSGLTMNALVARQDASCTVAFIDRTALPLLVQPIRRDLQISDTQMSLLIGFAFILTYSIGGLFVGALVDRFPRKRILAAGISFWATSTILCGTTFNYVAMFIGRCGVGLGEAAGGPACMSIIKDAFAPQ